MPLLRKLPLPLRSQPKVPRLPLVPPLLLRPQVLRSRKAGDKK